MVSGAANRAPGFEMSPMPERIWSASITIWSAPSMRWIRGARSRNARSIRFAHRSGGSNTCESDERITAGAIGFPPARQDLLESRQCPLPLSARPDRHGGRPPHATGRARRAHLVRGLRRDLEVELAIVGFEGFPSRVENGLLDLRRLRLEVCSGLWLRQRLGLPIEGVFRLSSDSIERLLHLEH